jgi:hypothetical protein
MHLAGLLTFLSLLLTLDTLHCDNLPIQQSTYILPCEPHKQRHNETLPIVFDLRIRSTSYHYQKREQEIPARQRHGVGGILPRH